MKALTRVVAALWVVGSASFAGDNPVVVELFTSQGCSSCPPADAILHKLSERDDVIALALHVDYWDYIGWRDAFAHPAHAERQRAYARVAGRRSIFTPEMIVNGVTDVVGARPMELSEAIARHAQNPDKVRVSLERTGDVVTIKAQSVGTPHNKMVVHMVRYQHRRPIDIVRGENAGRAFIYANVAQDWTVLGDWDGHEPLVLKAEALGADPVVVLIQADGAGPIVAAARLD